MKTLIALSLLFSAPALAEIEMSPNPPKYFGNERSERVREARLDPRQVLYGGPGCPDGTVTVTMAPDNMSFSVFFDRFSSQVAPSDDNVERKNCKIIIPFEIPAGMQLGITRADYRGFADIPQKSRAVLKSTYDFQGLRENGRPSGEFSQPVDLKYDFVGPTQQNYTISTGVINDKQYSPCGGFMRMTMNTVVALHNRNKNQTAMFTLDTIDAAGEMIYYMNWQKCSSGVQPPPGPPQPPAPPGPGGPPRPPPGPGRPPRR